MDAMIFSSLTLDLEIVISLFLLVWVYSWAKGNLGSPKLAIIFAAIIVYLTVSQHRELIWFGVILFLLATFGKELLAKFMVYEAQ
ncbi:MAG: hypothetical protein COT90_05405 [Candidatus Diapherotrites archaeon CG10_big_fil_rev_8_21_14_0_10_31_34]|nr:MAG: hypothetical protein COT90_05405 [Candidatus Diapherotrites archaeon CG10_big_fil_rev_8_21_14_0_10_31_34]